ncbi:uncharacterized protein [Rutidosis leptorrhynchoides]|uniref:uncharacterized protein n=1 Tax=Rutidosis leptorrhynchoides TaxID=125765 RepID=UPI003A996A33
MKLHLFLTILVLASLLAFKAQGIRLIKTSTLEKSSQDDHLLAKAAEISSGNNRKLMTKVTSSSATTAISKNLKKDGNKNDPKPELKSSDHSNIISSENSKFRKEFMSEQYADVIDIAEMDYTPARKKSPIHN